MTQKVRILVAEDEALIRMDLVEMLQVAGYEVVAEVITVPNVPHIKISEFAKLIMRRTP